MTTNPPWSPYYIMKGQITVPLCQKIIDYHSSLPYSRGEVSVNGKSIRNWDRNVELQGSELSWANDMILDYVKEANRVNFQYDLSEDDKEYLQFSRYGFGMYFHTHMDWDPHTTPTRKLSVTVQLSDPSSYKGGNLILYNCDRKSLKCPRDQGTIVIFDSRWLHRVTPILWGTRYSLVKWVHGDTPLK